MSEQNSTSERNELVGHVLCSGDGGGCTRSFSHEDLAAVTIVELPRGACWETSPS